MDKIAALFLVLLYVAGPIFWIIGIIHAANIGATGMLIANVVVPPIGAFMGVLSLFGVW